MAALPVYRKYLKYMRKITCVFIAISFAVCACSAVDGPKSGSKPKAKPELNNMVHYVVNNGKSGKSGKGDKDNKQGSKQQSPPSPKSDGRFENCGKAFPLQYSFPGKH